MTTYYNENNAFAASWLRELIKARVIAAGEVDERSIEDIVPSDLKGYTQCHFFAGIGVWSYALRAAGWPDDRPVWTGSCPCQPFSAAGQRKGTSDERHLWPAFFHLIEKCRPDTIFGEQVASKDGLAWLDTVSADLEGTDYTVGAADMCAPGFGAPHIRQRLYFVGHANNARSQGRRIGGNGSNQRIIGAPGLVDILADTKCTSGKQGRSAIQSASSVEETGAGTSVESGRCRNTRGLANSEGNGRRKERADSGRIIGGNSAEGITTRSMPSRAINGFWADADWIPCIDGKARPVEPSLKPLAHGVANRVGLLRGYGNSLVAPVAQGFIEAFLEVECNQLEIDFD